MTPADRLSRLLEHAVTLGAIVFVVGLLIRIWTIRSVRPDPSRVFMFDPTLYFALGSSLAHGDGFALMDVPTAAVSPGYPALLAASFAMFGTDVDTALAVNAVLGAATCVLAYLIGMELFGKGAGVVAGLVLAVLPGHALFASVLMAENFAAFLLTAAVYVAIRYVLSQRDGVALLPMALLCLIAAIGALTRGEMLPLVVVLAVAAFVPRRSLCEAARVGLPVLAAVTLATGGWVARNAVEIGSPVIATSTVSNALYISLGPHFNEFTPPDVQFADPSLPPKEYEVKASRAQSREALEYAAEHPAEELRRIPERFWRFTRGDDGALQWIRIDPAAVTDDERERLVAVGNLFYWPVLIAAIAGLPLWFRARDGRHVLLALTVVMWTAIHTVVFAGEPHYHVPIMPLIAVLAVGAAAAMVRRLRAADGT